MSSSSPSLEAFIANTGLTCQPLALVTSGGTRVPLEKSTVRSVENFSTGARGSSSTEAFLKQGYAVIFMYRRGSRMPYLWRLDPTGSVSESILDNAHASSDPNCLLFRSAVKSARLYLLPFTDVSEYLSLLKSTLQSMAPRASLSLYYAAAAVSDFHLPDLPEHKIQSGTTPGGGPAPRGPASGASGTHVDEAGRLHVVLSPVPKLLGELKSWCPGVYVCGFKLETDPEILAAKATGSLRRYGLDCVVANILKTRKEVCWVYTPHGCEELRSTELDADIVRAVARMHMDKVRETMDPTYFALTVGTKKGLREKRDRRVWEGMKGWKKSFFWASEKLGPVLGLCVFYFFKNRGRFLKN